MTPSVRKAKRPGASQLHARINRDGFQEYNKVASRLTAPQDAKMIVAFPGGAKALAALRNIATSPFGLRNRGLEAAQNRGLFPADITTDTKVIAGFDGKHLGVRASVLGKAREVFLATRMHPHTLGRRLCLGTFLPFHILIACNARVAGRTAPGSCNPLPK